MNAILRHRVIVLGFSMVAFLWVAAIGLMRPRSYTASSSFLLQSGSTPAGVSGLVAQLGAGVLVREANQSPDFYADLLRSREILGALTEAQYAVVSDTGVTQMTLYEIFEIEEETEALSRVALLRTLAGIIRSTVSRRTGLVTLEVTSGLPTLSEQMNRGLLDLLNAFNVNRRQSQAAAQRRFAGKRLAELRSELRLAEDELQTFLQGNRNYQNSAELRFQQDRLSRDVAMKQQIYASVAQAYEQARIDEVRDVPVITVVEEPEVPILPDGRGLKIKGLLALVLGGVLGGMVALAKDAMQHAETQSRAEFVEFLQLRKSIGDDIRHPWRFVRRTLGRGRGNRSSD